MPYLFGLTRGTQVENTFKANPATVDRDLAHVFEVNRYPVADSRLDLPRSPIRLLRMPDDHPWFQYCVHPLPLSVLQEHPMSDRPDLAALLGSRICHDLISPIGAIGNGVELMMMEGSTHGPEIALISESVASANARIRFFRVAYGVSSGDQRVGRPEVIGILQDISQGARVTIDWQVATDILRRELKLAFLGMQCLETALAFGGRIAVQNEGAKWTMTAHAPRMKIMPEVWEALSNSSISVEITPSLVQFALFPEELTRQTRRLTVEIRETEIKLSF
jgi:histidine phosphotransferase ChpT